MCPISIPQICTILNQYVLLLILIETRDKLGYCQTTHTYMYLKTKKS